MRRAVTVPIVKETALALEAVSHDPFIDDVAPPPPPPPVTRRRIYD